MIKYHRSLIIDVEATEDIPGVQPREIIEIGIVELDMNSLTILSRESIIVKPMSSKVTEFIEKLTGLTQEIVDGGILLKEACERLTEEYKSKEKLWMSQGNFDREIFRTNCIMYGIEYPFGPNHENIATLFSLLTGRKKLGMKKQVALLNLKFEGVHHKGQDDALNSTNVVIELLKRSRFKV